MDYFPGHRGDFAVSVNELVVLLWLFIGAAVLLARCVEWFAAAVERHTAHARRERWLKVWEKYGDERPQLHGPEDDRIET